jgi:hypothetical protein
MRMNKLPDLTLIYLKCLTLYDLIWSHPVYCIIIIFAASKHKDIEEVDCFACVISSHGRLNDWIWATDYPIEILTLMEPVMIDQCPKLANKPKLFFIQVGVALIVMVIYFTMYY